ncbi:rab-like protein 6 isoform X2 [Denticeps clupeoides]|uniref:rab-like protein 6 isoform X2 n=1 Tax=Denticeps clupeoides TaxID=299321 RepID=UPI0010A41509|nr:rab-like protein 6 isoform X2 [Denticeps clupeoides]
MLSALKKLVGSEPGQLRDKNIPAGLQSMNQSLQRRFAKGVQYNMKIVVRGDRNTGKSTLWHRLQGKKFGEEYIPTQEIQVTSIHWNYKTTDDVVKVEVWDVVDKGQKHPLPEGVGRGKKRGDNLKVENDPQESDNEVALDAEFLDVYKNCNGVIMMFDITKQWTYSYILRELPKVPNHVPVCVLGNYRDMGEHRVILPDDIRDFIAGLNRPLGSSYIHYAESSMKNGFGLKYLHRFFNIPFLQLQRETLLRQLETNQLDIDATLEELTVQQETEDQNYNIFLEMMDVRKGYSSPVPANGQSPSSGSQSPSSSPGTPQPPVPSQGLQSPSSSPSPPPPPPPISAVAAPPVPESQAPENPPTSSAAMPSPTAPAQAPPSQKRSFISRLFGSASTPEPPAAKPEPPPSACPEKVQSVDDFVPDDSLDRSFLEDSIPAKARVEPQMTHGVDSDSEAEGRGANPMVAGFQDDLDLDDEETSPLPPPDITAPSKDITLSSDEDVGERGLTVAQDEDLVVESDLPTKAINSLSVKEKAKSAVPVPPDQTDKSGRSRTTESSTPLPALGQSVQRSRKESGGEAESSDTDHEVPVAKQMLSFVMDDPDFESEGSDTKVTSVSFPVRADVSDLSEDDAPARMPEPLKPTMLSFKNKDENDLFDLGFEEKSTKSKDSSDDQDVKESKHSSKEKKKKKKKTKEDEDKSSKKRHKHKKKEKEDTGTGDEEKKKKKSRSKKGGDLDDLESFLAGGEGPMKRDDGDYEEL